MDSIMDYSGASCWELREKQFDTRYLGKCEAVMCLGNGYLGLRSATEECYLNEKRDLFIAGTFNQFDQNEVTELPNAADLIGMEILVNDERFNLEKGTIKQYQRSLNLKTGLLKREIVWESEKGTQISMVFSRIVSFARRHVIAQKIDIFSEYQDVEIKVVSGINGQMTNTGVQHFCEGDKRLFDKTYMQYTAMTNQSKVEFVYHTGLRFRQIDENIKLPSKIVMDRRKIYTETKAVIKKGQSLTIEKISNVHTSRDLEHQGKDFWKIKEDALNEMKIVYEVGYDYLAEESAKAWNEKVWNNVAVTIDSEEEQDQLALRFAQYHLYVMTPAHDNRMNIAAKGLSGEGYKGHTFWDTEIFALPYFTFTNPDIARKLIEYRYLSLPGARRKAQDNGYEGAMYPWESAWLDDGEVTPVWGAADIITGLPTKIWSGFIEQHITCDVAFGVWQYYLVTNDQDFMNQYGYEIILDTAKFWVSRLEWNESDQKYHINDVVGPDEYKEHVNDNAFTNYMAYWNIEKALEYYQLLQTENPVLFEMLVEKLQLDAVVEQWREKSSLIHLPKPRETDLVIPQHATYLDLKEIDLTKYKQSEQVGTLFDDYNLEQVNEMQISKQADLLILFFLMENQFNLDVKKSNWNYYEPRTLHDSSLSLSTHSILASDMNDKELAYQLFKRASNIDMGPNMKSSNDGIHAASIAGIWQAAVFGFGGVRMLDGELRIQPNLPSHWKTMSFYIVWHGQKLKITISSTEIEIQNQTKTKEVFVKVNGQMYSIADSETMTMAKIESGS